MRFEVLHGNIDEVDRDLAVESEAAPYRLRRIIGDAVEKTGYAEAKKEDGSWSVYTAELSGKNYLLEMLVSPQSTARVPANYFHALATEMEPQDYLQPMDAFLNRRFADENDVAAAAAGTAYHAAETDEEGLEVSIHPEVMREIFNAAVNRWGLGQPPVIFLVPEEAPFRAYVKAAVEQIYAYFPAALRANAGFVCNPKEDYEADRRVGIIFMAENEENAQKENALTATKSSGYFSTLLIPELLPFADYLFTQNAEARAALLQEIFETLEGNGDEAAFKAVEPRSYASYVNTKVAWEDLDQEAFVLRLSDDIRKTAAEKENMDADKYHALELILAQMFPPEHDMTSWFLLKAAEVADRKDILLWVDRLNQINREFPNFGWKKEAGIEYIAERILKECGGNEYKQYEVFDAERRDLVNYFGPLVVQNELKKLEDRREELVESQYEQLKEDIQEDPENVELDEAYPENKTRSSQRFVETANSQFHQLIREFKEGDKVDALFEKLRNKIELCNGFSTEYAVVNMQQCYDAYWGLWQAAQSPQAKSLDAYFRVMAQIAQIPSKFLRPAMLTSLRQWLSNMVDMVQYLDGYENFCMEKLDMTEEFKKNLKVLVAEDFQILSHHPFHITFTNTTSIQDLFNDCHHYLERLETCHLENIRAEVLLQFASPKLIENYLLSVQELMDIIQFILLNATTHLPKLPHDKLKEIIIAFAALGSFTSRHFEPLMNISRSTEYREKLWRYCMEAAEGNLNEQVKIFEIYENIIGALDARKHLNRWAKDGAVTDVLYERLIELHQDDPAYSIAMGDSVNNNRYLNETEEIQDVNFDLTREEVLRTWDKHDDETIFTEEISNFNREIENEQEIAMQEKTGTDIPYVVAKTLEDGSVELPKKAETKPKKGKKKKHKKHPAVRIAIAVVIIYIIIQIIRKLLGA